MAQKTSAQKTKRKPIKAKSTAESEEFLRKQKQEAEEAAELKDFDAVGIDGYKGSQYLKKAGTNVEWTNQLISEYLKCQDDVEYFITKYVEIFHVDEEAFLPFNLWDYQKTFVQNIVGNRFNIAKLPRQVGKTTTVAAVILWYILFRENYKVAILANKGEQSQEILERIQAAYERLPLWLQQGVVTWNKRSIVLENGSRIIAASTSSSSIRGRTQNMIYLDEFAQIETQTLQEKFFTSTYPVISSGKTTKVIITSTPKGLDMFYKLWTDSEKGRNSYVRTEVHWSQVPGRSAEWAAETISNTSQRQFDQEFECHFLGSSDTLISGVVLRSLSFNEPIEQNDHLKIYELPIKGHTYVMAVDCSRGVMQDYHAFLVIDMNTIPYRVVASYRNNDLSTLLFPNVIAEAARRYHDAYVLVEINDLGQQVVDILYRDIEYENVLMSAPAGKQGVRISSGFGVGTKLGVRTTKQTKRIGCMNFKTLVEARKLELNDFELLSELATFVAKPSGSYGAEDGKHDDLAMCGVIFGWFQNQQFARDLTNTDLREHLYKENIRSIEDDLAPAGMRHDARPEIGDGVLDVGYDHFTRVLLGLD